MRELIEEYKLNKVAYLLERLERKDFDSKVEILRKLEKMKITKNIGLFLIESSVRNYGFNDNNGGINSSILTLCFREYYDEYTDAIKKIFKKLKPNVQNKVVYLLSTVDNKSALKLYVDLVLRYYKNSDFIPISNLFERPYLYDILFPKLYKALSFKNPNNNILILVNDYLNAGVVRKEDIKKNKKIITDSLLKVFNKALKYNYKTTFEYLNDENYISERFFLEICINIESYVSTKETSLALEKLLKKKDNQLKLFILENYQNKNIEIKKSSIDALSKDNSSRYALYEMLNVFDKLELMDDKYKTREMISESDFYINFGIYCNYKVEPKNISLVDKININGYEYFVYKYSLTYEYNNSTEFLTNYIFNMVGFEKYNGMKITSEFIAISGGYDSNSNLNLVQNKLNKFLFKEIDSNSNIDEIARELLNEIKTKKNNKLKELLNNFNKKRLTKELVKQEKIENEKITQNISDNEENDINLKKESKINKLFSYSIYGLFIIFVIMLISCTLFVNNFAGIGDSLNKNIIKSVKLNKDFKYTLIDGKDIFKEKESEYYVLLYKKDGDESKYYNYINEYSKYNKTFYFVDLNDDKNKFLYDDNELSFTLTGDRLLKVKDSEYQYFVDGENNILTEMKNDIKSLSEKK